MGRKLLSLNYALAGTKIHVEGMENIPTDRPVCFAMNHTDRYNYWPFQLAFKNARNQYTCSWVKAKYFENPLLRHFMLWTSNIPLASKGYVIAKRFQTLLKRNANSTEYRFIRDLLDGKISLGDQALTDSPSSCRQLLGPNPNATLRAMEDEFRALSTEVVRLNQQALDLGHPILVFPQGTRSLRLTKGPMGIAQMTQCLGIDVVPVACMGSEKAYPGNSPFARRGSIRYVVGKPLRVDGPELAELRIEEKIHPIQS